MPEIYTVGYAAKGCDEYLVWLMADPQMILVDIRLKPQSRFYPAYRRTALREKYGERYVYVPQLGNLNYQDRSRPAHLQNGPLGIDRVLSYLLRGYSVCLMCACADFGICHRRLVSSLVEYNHNRCLEELKVFSATPSYVERFKDGRESFDERVAPSSVLNLRAFTRWLCAHLSDVVGSTAMDEACPLARFLTDMTGCAYQVGYDDYALVSDKQQDGILPDWARILVRSLDFSFPLCSVTGEQVLCLLSSFVFVPVASQSVEVHS